MFRTICALIYFIDLIIVKYNTEYKSSYFELLQCLTRLRFKYSEKATNIWNRLKRKPRLSQKLITILMNNTFDSLKNIQCASKFEIKNWVSTWFEAKMNLVIESGRTDWKNILLKSIHKLNSVWHIFCLSIFQYFSNDVSSD